MAWTNSPWYFHELSKNLHDYHTCLSSLAKNVFIENKNLSTWETSCVNAHMLEFPVALETALLEKFWWEFVTNTSVASISPVLIFFEVNLMIPRWWKFYLICSWLSKEKPNCLWLHLKSWQCLDFLKNHNCHSNLACDWLKSFSQMIRYWVNLVHDVQCLTLIYRQFTS